MPLFNHWIFKKKRQKKFCRCCVFLNSKKQHIEMKKKKWDKTAQEWAHKKNLFGTVRMGLKCLQHGKMHTFFSVCCYFSFQIPLKHFSPNQFIPKNFFHLLGFFYTLFRFFRWTSTVEIFFYSFLYFCDCGLWADREILYYKQQQQSWWWWWW